MMADFSWSYGTHSQNLDSGRITGDSEVTFSRFQADSDDVIPKSASRRSPLISPKPVSG
jgi:hypothetical protein